MTRCDTQGAAKRQYHKRILAALQLARRLIAAEPELATRFRYNPDTKCGCAQGVLMCHSGWVPYQLQPPDADGTDTDFFMTLYQAAEVEWKVALGQSTRASARFEELALVNDGLWFSTDRQTTPKERVLAYLDEEIARERLESR